MHKNQKRFRIVTLTSIALMTAIIVICSWIMIKLPIMPIQFSMQTFAVYAALFILGGKKGTAAIVAYVAMGAIGVPVFTGFSGGLGVLAGPTGGYIFGFIISAIVYTLLERFAKKGFWSRMSISIFSYMFCYIAGTVMFVFVNTYGYGLWASIMACVVPFIIPDLLKILLAAFIADRLKKPLEGLLGQG